MTARETFDTLKARSETHQPRHLDPFFDTLEPIPVNDMLGPWRGGVFRTGSLWEKPLGCGKYKVVKNTKTAIP